MENYHFNSEEGPLDITRVVNEETLLYFALNIFNGSKEEDSTKGVAESIIYWYILRKFQKNSVVDFTEDDIVNEFSSLVSSNVFDSLVSKGLLEEKISEDDDDLEPSYVLTELGNVLAERLKTKEANDGK